MIPSEIALTRMLTWRVPSQDRASRQRRRPSTATQALLERFEARVRQGSYDLDDVAATLPFHRRHRGLGSEEDTVEIGRITLAEQLFGDVFDAARAPNARIVDQRINAAETVERGLHHLPRNRWITDVTCNGDVVGIIGRLIDREFPTARQPRSR